MKYDINVEPCGRSGPFSFCHLRRSIILSAATTEKKQTNTFSAMRGAAIWFLTRHPVGGYLQQIMSAEREDIHE